MRLQDRRHWRAGLVNVALGGWLMFSVLGWAHTRAELWYSCIIGAAIAAVSVVGWAWERRLRWVDLGLAMALFLATVLTSHVEPGLALNHLIVSLAVLVVSFLPLVTVSDEPAPSWSVGENPDV